MIPDSQVMPQIRRLFHALDSANIAKSEVVYSEPTTQFVHDKNLRWQSINLFVQNRLSNWTCETFHMLSNKFSSACKYLPNYGTMQPSESIDRP